MWNTPLILALGDRNRLIQEFKASLVYRLSSKTAKTTQRNPALKNKTKVQHTHTHTHIDRHTHNCKGKAGLMSLKDTGPGAKLCNLKTQEVEAGGLKG